MKIVFNRLMPFCTCYCVIYRHVSFPHVLTDYDTLDNKSMFSLKYTDIFLWVYIHIKQQNKLKQDEVYTTLLYINHHL